MNLLFSLVAIVTLISPLAHAGGAIVVGGKTNSAVLIYENQLGRASQRLVLHEIGRQIAMGKISAYGTVEDEQGNPVKCAQFALLQTYSDSLAVLKAIAEDAGAPDAVRAVGSCRLDTIE